MAYCYGIGGAGETLEKGGASDRVNENENWGKVDGGRVNGRHQMVPQRDSGNSGGNKPKCLRGPFL